MRVYLSHPIPGVKGAGKADGGYIKRNNQMAKAAAGVLRAYGVEVYCPAEHEEFISRAYDNKMLTEDQLLDIDCEIIDHCDYVAFYNHEGCFSGGMKIEYRHTLKQLKPCATCPDLVSIDILGRHLEGRAYATSQS